MPAATFYSSTKIYDMVIKKLEKPLVNMFALASNWLPEPTHENVNKHNTHILIDLRDELLARWPQSRIRKQAFRGMFNFIISKYDRDDVNGGYLDDFFAEWLTQDWLFKQGIDLTERKKYIAEALKNKDFDRVLQVID